MKEHKLNYIDALRGIAILGVIIVHCGQFGNNHYPAVIQNIIVDGAMGVQLFFVASALTIFLTFGNRQGKEINPVSNFFVRRFFRIAPMYYLGIIYYLYQDGWGARYWLGDAPAVSLWNVVSNLFFVHGINPYWITSVVEGGWSITVEASFYLLVPILFCRIKNLNQAVAFFLLTILLRMILSLILHRFPLIAFDRLWGEYLFFYAPNQMPVFASGLILYFLVCTPRSEWHVDPPILFMLTIFALAQLATHTFLVFPRHILFGGAFVILGYVLSRREFYLLVNPLTIYIGKISYSMYLVHFAVLHALKHFDLLNLGPTGAPYLAEIDFLLRLFCVTGLTALISTITYRLIEVPFQDIGKKIIQRKESAHQKTPGLVLSAGEES